MSGVSDRYRTLETAKALTRNGVSIIPIKANGSKAPVIKWKTYQSEIADTATLEKWFSVQHYCRAKLIEQGFKEYCQQRGLPYQTIHKAAKRGIKRLRTE